MKRLDLAAVILGVAVSSLGAPAQKPHIAIVATDGAIAGAQANAAAA
jgi:hypothetical protein